MTNNKQLVTCYLLLVTYNLKTKKMIIEKMINHPFFTLSLYILCSMSYVLLTNL